MTASSRFVLHCVVCVMLFSATSALFNAGHQPVQHNANDTGLARNGTDAAHTDKLQRKRDKIVRDMNKKREGRHAAVDAKRDEHRRRHEERIEKRDQAAKDREHRHHHHGNHTKLAINKNTTRHDNNTVLPKKANTTKPVLKK